MSYMWHRSNDGENFDKERYRGEIFRVAQATIPNLVYIESIAASYFFHVKEGEEIAVYETHLTDDKKEKSQDWNVLRYSQWCNKTATPPAPPRDKRNFLVRMFDWCIGC